MCKINTVQKMKAKKIKGMSDVSKVYEGCMYITNCPMSKVSKEITMCINIILMIFISHVRGVEGYVHNMHTFNGKHVGGVESLFDLHLGF